MKMNKPYLTLKAPDNFENILEEELEFIGENGDVVLDVRLTLYEWFDALRELRRGNDYDGRQGTYIENGEEIKFHWADHDESDIDLEENKGK